MILGLDLFGANVDNSTFQTQNNVNGYYKLDLSNSIVDEVSIRKNTSIPFNSTKSVWQLDQVLLAKFQNDLEGGNLNLSGSVVDKLLYKRRNIDDISWTTFYECDFNPSINIYTVLDKFVEAGETYEYAIVPKTADIEGEYLTEQITCNFEGAYVFDKSTQFKLLYNLELGDINQVQPSNLIETMGGKYPIILFSSELNYRKGNIKCLLLSDSSLTANQNGQQIDVRQEKILRKQIIDWLTNKKPKVLKHCDGTYLMFNITDPPVLTPSNDIVGLYNLSFSFIESGDVYDEDTLKSVGLL